MYNHASRLSAYRKPFGARPTSDNVSICFDVDEDSTDVTLCYSYGLYQFSYHEEPMRLMQSGESGRTYCSDLRLPSEVGLVFYWFKFEVTYDKACSLLPEFIDCINCRSVLNDKVVLFYVADIGTGNGEGKIYYEPPRIGVEENKYPYAWQITVYDRDYRTPDYLKGAIMYQIFPDRFARDKDFSYEKMVSSSQRDERIYHENWNEEVDIYGKPDTGYLACDFYGGSLYGIAEKMDYIKSLGVNVLYLNPIFEARSSHRYDTSNYLNVDPILGGNEAFEELISEADKREIKVVLDGVFSHTGADSIYFNKFGRYAGIGAYRSFVEGIEDPYRSWYNFHESGTSEVLYDSWWGFPDLPNVNENDLSYRRFLFDKNGVVNNWIGKGASGFRLDVSDELPDSFIREMRETVKRYSDGQGIVIGEVWEDASNKCSYGSYRDFLLGRTHDSVMGYTFREGLLSFLKCDMNALEFDSYMEGYRERYPSESYYSMMNLISSHDVPRAITELVGDKDPGERQLQIGIFLSDEQLDIGIKLMRMAFAYQIGYIGCPCVYYGDEVLAEGYRDPFNRRTYPWDFVEGYKKEQLDFYRDIAKLREENPVLKTGCYRTLFKEEYAIAFERTLDSDLCDYFGKKVVKGSKRIVLLLNNNKAKNILFDSLTSSCELFSSESESEIRRECDYVVEVNDASHKKFCVEPMSFMFVIY